MSNNFLTTIQHLLIGSKEVRGLAALDQEIEDARLEAERNLSTGKDPYKVYELPFQHVLNKYDCLKWIPFCPQYKELKLPSSNCRNRKDKTDAQTVAKL